MTGPSLGAVAGAAVGTTVSKGASMGTVDGALRRRHPPSGRERSV